ncbi:hypothetical protein ACHQM5_030379 [Ranunculus cassubicifolius]
MEAKKLQKSYFDVLGICCSSEIPLINNALKPLGGVIEVNVIVASRTVIVIHDNELISQIQIVRALKSARFEANVRVYGEQKHGTKWPKPYTIACGVLVLVSTFKYVYHPLVWVGLGAVALGILPILLRSMVAVRNRNFDVNILVLVAVIGAIVLGDYWEAGTTVFLFTIAEWLESRASQKANVVMSSLMSMAPQKAVLAETGQTIDTKDIKIGTILAVKTGEVIPIDGIVRDGKCEVDEKTLTGEPLPVTKQAESTVWAGTINLNGYITVRTMALAEDCVVAKMAKLVEEAQNSKSKTQRLVDQFAQYYTPVVVLASLAIFLVPVALRKHDIRHWAHLALVVLVSACPCALILSTPVATFCAFTKAATDGILIKGGDYLEILGKIKTMAFDKTGTITRGEFSVTDFRSTNADASLDTLLFWVSSIESKASHPMAVALVDYAEMNSVKPKPESVKEFQNYPGEGIYGEIEGRNIYVGNRKIARRASCETVPLKGDDRKGETLGYIFSGEHQLGVFSMADTCRTGVLEAIKELKSLGIRTAMLTGDSQSAAMQVQDKLGQALDEIHAELLPQDKVLIIKELKTRGPTAMIGDGVNDAPALATADVGFSMGISGSALATETGHITLMSNDIRKVPQAIRLARKTLWKIRQNVALSFVTKAAILTLAFCGHPILWAAVLADVGTCLLVIFNSMLILGTSMNKRKSHSHHSHTDHVHGGKPCSHDHHHSHTDNVHDCSDTRTDHVHDHLPVCGPKDEHPCTRRRTACQTGETNLCLVKCNDHRVCSTPQSHSHAIQINRVHTEVHRSDSNMHDEHVGCTGSSHNNQHGSHSTCLHNQHSHLNHVQENNCNSGVIEESGCCSVTCIEPIGCHNLGSESPSHVVDIAKVVKDVQASKNSSNDEHSTLVKKVPARDSSEAACQGHHDHHHHHHHNDHQSHHIHTNHSDGHHRHHAHSDHQDPLLNGSESSKGICRDELKTMHICSSLDKRGVGGCCRSYRRECGGMHGCLGNGTGGLTEIISE